MSLYLPELTKLKSVSKNRSEHRQKAFETVEAQRDITIQDLLGHTSGFTSGRLGGRPVKKLYREAKLATALTVPRF